MRTLLLGLFATYIAFGAPQQTAKETAAGPNPLPNQTLVNRYCVTCHNQKLRTAKLALDTLDLTHPEKDALTWERAIRKLRGGMMPPPGAPRPPLAAVNVFATYLEDTLDKAATANANPGSVRIHRLNIPVRATIHTLGGFSAHAGQSELLRWATPLVKYSPRVYLTHGEDMQRTALAAKVKERFGLVAGLPKKYEVVEL